ncbi:MAG: spinster family MFS transporter [Janthinobacterium lividum]
MSGAIDPPLYSRRYRIWMMILLIGVYASSSLDRLVVATLAPALKGDLHISDFQFGLLGGIVFAVLFTLAGIPIAHLADRRKRMPILAIAITFWSATTALSGLAANFGQLLLMRVGVSLGEAGCSPTSYSLISDHYPAQRRAGAVAILGLGVPLGSMSGALLGGWASEHSGWRTAFVIAGVPGFVLALLVLLTLREPPRGHFDRPGLRDVPAPPLSDVLRRIWSKSAYVHLMAAAALCIFCNNGLNLFMPSFFVRSHGLGAFEAGKYFGVLIGVAATLGTVGLGLLIGRIGRRDARWYGWAPALIMVLGVPLYVGGFLATSFAASYSMLFAATCIGFAFLGPVVGATQNMMEPRSRATAAAVLLVAMHLIGGGSGPTFVGWASDFWASHSFAGDYALSCPRGLPAAGVASALATSCRHAAADGLRDALLMCSLFFLWAAFHCVMAARTIRRDLLAAVAELPSTARGLRGALA